MHFVPTYPRFPPLTGILSPNCLTQVCRTWRDIALAIPTLWRAIPLSFNDINSERQAQIITDWLSRSRSCPLSIRIHEEEYPFLDALEAPMRHHARWECIKLNLSSSKLLALQGSLPLLRHLDLELNDDQSVAIDVVAFRDLPRLRSVVLNDIAASSVKLPWAQLTYLTLNRVYLHECVPVLRQTTNLVHCELRLFYTLNKDGNNITLPSLESLALTDPGHQPITKYLETFVVPALRSLRVPEPFIGADPVTMLASFMSKSCCKLQELCITGKLSVPKNTYQEVFPSIPKLSFRENFSSRYYDCMADEETSEVDDIGDSDSLDTTSTSSSEE
ncbi:hypothetical protein B0H19DRAFT_1226909 [Mycena capillaripes]|nr:hypothetical protein B0H19DRAFT_1226909 [Mycena capillaripes]